MSVTGDELVILNKRGEQVTIADRDVLAYKVFPG